MKLSIPILALSIAAAGLGHSADPQTPNIVYILWDDTAFGAAGFPALQKNFGYETPNLNKMAEEGINFTRMYTEPSCTPTRAAFLTGRHPVRHGMGVVGMPHEFSGLRAEEVTIAEVLSDAGYATGFFGKGHLGDIEESYAHNQGFDEAFFTGTKVKSNFLCNIGYGDDSTLRPRSPRFDFDEIAEIV